MIKVIKGDAPSILKEKGNLWTDELTSAIAQYGSFSALPLKEKSIISKRYGDSSIRQALQGKRAKCVYCESPLNVSGDEQVEHYYPKSRYPEQTFVWDNLFPACMICNRSKGDFDTKNNPFVHPVDDDPEDHFTYEDCMIVPRDSNDISAKNVIEQCDLTRTELCRAHAELIGEFHAFRNELEKRIKEYDSLKSNKRKEGVAISMLDAFKNLNQMAGCDKGYAGFIRYLIRNSRTIKEALIRVKNHEKALETNGCFQWCFVL